MIQDPVALLSFLFAVVALTRYLESKHWLFEKATSAILCTLLGIILANLGVIPFSSPAYQVVFDFGIPYAIVLVILASDLKQLARAGRPVIVAFAIAAAGSVLGGFAAGVVFESWLGPETWKLSGAFAGAFVGGGMNFAAIGSELQIAPSTFAAAAVADNLSTVPYMLTQIALVGLLAPLYRRRCLSAAMAGAGEPAETPADDGPSELDDLSGRATGILRQWTETSVNITDLAVIAALPLAVLWLARSLVALVPAMPEVLWITTLAFVIAQIPVIRKLRGAMVGAYFTMHIFFLALGASSIVSEVFKIGAPIFLFMILIIAVHVLVAYGLGWLIRLDLPTITVASAAAIGGAGSGLALAMIFKWPKVITSSIVVSILGYALGNYLGLSCAYLVRALG